MGFSGLWNIPTKDIIPKHKVAFSYYHRWYDASDRLFNVTEAGSSYSISRWQDWEASEYSMTYGIMKNTEISISGRRTTMDGSIMTSGLESNYNTRFYGEGEGYTYGVKFNPRHHYMLKDPTHKEWEIAFGALREEYEGLDNTYIFGVLSIPMPKFDFHVGLFHYNMEYDNGKEMGTMAGLEIPIQDDWIFLGEAILFQSEYTYNFATRYIYRERSSILLGISDTTDLQYTELGLSVQY